MAQDIGVAYIHVEPSGRGFGKSIEGQITSAAQSGSGKASNSIVSLIGGAFGKVGKIGTAAVGTIATGIMGLAAKGGFDRALNIENAQAKLKGLGHSSEDVTEIMNDALDSVKGTAFGLGDAATVAASLSASGIKSGADLTKVLKTVGDTAQISGRSLTDIGTIFGSVAARGKLQGDDMLQLMSSGIPVLSMLGKHLGKTSAEVSEMVSKGQVDFQTFADAMQEGMGGAALKAGDTFQGALSNVKAALSRLGETAATPVMNGLRDMFNQAIPAIDSFAKKATPAIQRFGNAVGAAFSRAVPTVGRFGTAIGKAGEAVADLAVKVRKTAGFQAFSVAVTNLRDALGDAWGMLKKTSSGVLDSMSAMTGSRPVVVAFANAFRFLSDKVATVANGIRLAVQAISLSLEGLSGGTAVDDIASVFDQLRVTIGNVKAAAMDFLSGVASSSMWREIGQVARTVAQAFDDITWKVWSALDALNTQPGFDWAGLGKRIGDAFGAAIGAVNSIAKAFADMASRDLQPLADAIGNIATAIAGVGVDVLEKLADALTRLSDWVDAHSQGVANAITAVGLAFLGWKGLDMTIGAVTTALNAFSAVCNGLSGGLMAVMSMGTGLKGLGDAIKGLGIATAFSGAISSAKDLGAAISLIPEALGEAGAVIGPKLAAIGGAISSALAPILTNPWTLVIVAIAAVVTGLVLLFTKTEWGKKAWQSFTTWLTTTWESIKQTASTVFTAIGNAISTAWNAVSNATTEAWNAIWGFLQPILTTMGHFFFDFGIVVAAVFVTLWRAVSAATTEAWNAIWGFLQPILSAIGNAISSACNSISNAWNSAWNAIWGFLQPILTTIGNAISSACNAISNAWNSAWNAVGNVFRTVWNAICGFIRTVLSNIGNSISSACNSISNAWNSAWNSISNVFRNAWNGMTGAVSSAANAIGSTVSGIKDKITSVFRGAGSWLSDAGRQVIQGLINGIGDKVGAVKDKIEGLGHNVVGWAKGVLGIHSPSRVMRDQVGVMVGRGMAVGIDRTRPIVSRSMSRLAGMVSLDGVGAWDRSAASAGGALPVRGVQQVFNTKVVRSDADWASASTILVRNAMQAAQGGIL